MPEIEFLNIFQGIATMLASDPHIAVARVVLIALGIAFVYWGVKGTLEPLIMIPMGIGMACVNAGVLFLSAKTMGTIFIDPIASEPAKLLDVLQIDFLQPIYTFTFSNGLIACLIFMGIGAISDVGYMLIAPVRCMFIAVMAELGTLLTFPIAVAMGLTYKEAAAIAMVGGADGPMVLYTSLMLSRDLFVPITIVAYLYLSLCYAGYPYLVRLLVPKHLRGIKMDQKSVPNVTAAEKITFSIITATVLCLLFPVAAPLFMSFFLGVIVRESGVKQYVEFLTGPVLYGSTFFLGLLLGVLFEANTILNPKVILLLFLGMTALLLSGIGGIIGGYIVYWTSGRTFNPVIGIAGVSCVPTTAKVAQKEAHDANKFAMILPWAMGACVSGVITSAIIAGIYVTVLQNHAP
ncbi:MAG: sodium ion-translocating decarboxylase subunit beta [Polaromonas sp.]|uniref:sodium ion-translocating decarboxylase subunit beta n=1 Tax=Polaromonas sp. TaxID=1869339 RepID=UPI0025F93BC0|nr:sodium ion-translocating decarboxylase subunit beta [Polaromonas sp.]MBI2725853.1 sodium ion-translocating decarboxylase subunit beta [Polaromonas sp.]